MALMKMQLFRVRLFKDMNAHVSGLINKLAFSCIGHRRFKVALTIFYVALVGISALQVGNAYAVETIVLLRHAEKPGEGFGQLSCQGLNRAIALPKVLVKKFGKPDAIFAPDPSIKKEDHGVLYSYIRPLATIEPTAISAGLSVNVQWGFDDIEPLQQALMDSSLKAATVFVVWEHRLLDEIAKGLLAKLNISAEAVPTWGRGDFDSIYVITISEDRAGNKTAVFNTDKEGLNLQSTTCP